ncbi:MAG TPA: hypothetical protein VFE51_19125 [Verrucomicrobiae bacterium]|nr:hypothetical protein [Verrucomicrobiae bacterium]
MKPSKLIKDPKTGLSITKSPPGQKVTSENVRNALNGLVAGAIVQYSRPVDDEEAKFRFILLAPPEKGKVDIQLICDWRLKPWVAVNTKAV